MIIKVQDTTTLIERCRDALDLIEGYFKTLDGVDRDKEHFFAFHLDTRNKLKVFEVVSIGTVNASIVHPREVFTRAVALRTTQVIIAHNHPSGNPEPSEADIQITKRLRDAGDLLGIQLVDHLIYTSHGYYSFKESNAI